MGCLPQRPEPERPTSHYLGEFPKIGGALFWGPYDKDPAIWGTILGAPIFGNPRFESYHGKSRKTLQPRLDAVGPAPKLLFAVLVLKLLVLGAPSYRCMPTSGRIPPGKP